MRVQPDYRRLLTTIRREEPDRVPLAELGVDTPVKEAFMGRAVRDVRDEVAFWARAGYDYLYLRPDYEYLGAPPIVATGTPRAWEASAADHDAESISTTLVGPVQALADVDNYPWPDPEAVDCSNLEEAATLLPASMASFPASGASLPELG